MGIMDLGYSEFHVLKQKQFTEVLKGTEPRES